MKKFPKIKMGLSKILIGILLVGIIISSIIIFEKGEDHLYKFLKEKQEFKTKNSVSQPTSYIEVHGTTNKKCSKHKNEKNIITNPINITSYSFSDLTNFQSILNEKKIKYDLSITPHFDSDFDIVEVVFNGVLIIKNEKDILQAISLIKEFLISINMPSKEVDLDESLERKLCMKEALNEAINDAKFKAKILGLKLKSLVYYNTKTHNGENFSVTYIAK